MKVTAYKTPMLTANDDLLEAIASSIPQISERNILVVASKAVSTCENRFVQKENLENGNEKHTLVRREADLYTDPHSSKYNLMLTVKRNWMFVNAGIDESNANGSYILWPKDPQQSVNNIWKFVRSHYHLKEVGVTMSDSSSMPLNWGIVGHAIAFCGFHPLKSYIGKADLFGRKMVMEQINIAQSVTTAAVYVMGEGDERTPLGLVEDVGNVEFKDHVPTKEELNALHIKMEDDAFAPILQKADWKKGGGGVE